MIATNIKARYTPSRSRLRAFDLRTGEPWDHIWVAPWLRNATEDMTTLMHTYQREQALGREHPEWLAWVKSYSDWLADQQRPDGSYPRRWKPGTNEVMEPTGTSGYNVIPLFVLMTQITGDQKYQAAAIRAAEYVWSTWGTRGLSHRRRQRQPQHYGPRSGYVESRGLPRTLRCHNGPHKWLERAKAAGQLRRKLDLDFGTFRWLPTPTTRSCIGKGACPPWVCSGHHRGEHRQVPTNISTGPCRPMPRLYKENREIPTISPLRAVLLMDTKSMVALDAGRQYDMRGIGATGSRKISALALVPTVAE